MEAEYKPLMDAIRERYDRATEVALTYHITEVGPAQWVMTHPNNDTEGEDAGRSYLVDLLRGTCECPDHQCRQPLYGDGFFCKHEVTAAKLYAEKYGEPYIKPREVDHKLIEASRGLSKAIKAIDEDPYRD